MGNSFTDVDGICMHAMMQQTGDYAWVSAQAAQLKNCIDERIRSGYREADAVAAIRNHWHRNGSLKGFTVLMAVGSFEELKEGETTKAARVKKALSTCQATVYDLSHDQNTI